MRSQIESRAERELLVLEERRVSCMLPVAVSIPSIETKIRSLFEEASYLELECIKAITDLEKLANRRNAQTVVPAHVL